MGSYSSMGFLQNSLNNAVVPEPYSSDNLRSATHISTDATFGRMQLLGTNQDHFSAMKTTSLYNDQGKGAKSLRNKASGDSQHSENKPEQAIFEAFNSNTMETIYNRSSPMNEEVNNMFSSCDYQISQASVEPLEITSVGGAASNIEPTTHQSVPTLPSSDQNPSPNGDSSARKRSKKRSLEIEAVPEEARERIPGLEFGNRTSFYRGVTKHRWTGRFEAHLWDNSEKRAGQSRKGRQVYLGGYDSEDKAARAYDMASLKFWGPLTLTNFPLADYEKELEEMKFKSKYEYVTILRRRSSGFSRGASVYRGVTRHHQNGRWQARIGRVAGNKDLYLGTYATQEEAAEAYDIATIKYRGQTAVTNFDISRYDVQKIMNTPLPIGGLAKRIKMEEMSTETSVDGPQFEDESTVSSKGDSAISGNAFSASTERNGGVYQQQENPWMTSYQGGHLPVQANEAHILNFPAQLHPANYEKYFQLQSMLASKSQFQYNLMGLNPAAINTGNNGLLAPLIYKNMSVNSAANGLPLDYSFVPSSTLPYATSNPYAHDFNGNLNAPVGLKTEGTENMLERFSGLSGPGYESLIANAQQDGTFSSGFRT
uniref:Babyboom2 n=1 Tax=Thuja koraiensis TaxID=241616 RepID=A0A4Y5QMF3_9CONI|nr:babyboom2 [Thuja koraiensis]